MYDAFHFPSSPPFFAHLFFLKAHCLRIEQFARPCFVCARSEANTDVRCRRAEVRRPRVLEPRVPAIATTKTSSGGHHRSWLPRRAVAAAASASGARRPRKNKTKQVNKPTLCRLFGSRRSDNVERGLIVGNYLAPTFPSRCRQLASGTSTKNRSAHGF